MTRHEIPTHLEAPDRFALGLTATQAMHLVGAASIAYGLLDVHWLAWEARATAAVLAFVLGVVLALVRPGGRALEEWVLLLAAQVATPARMVWRPCPAPLDPDTAAWVALIPRVDWSMSTGRDGGSGDAH